MLKGFSQKFKSLLGELKWLKNDSKNLNFILFYNKLNKLRTSLNLNVE